MGKSVGLEGPWKSVLEPIETQVGRRNLSERLEQHPELKERFAMILDIVENTCGDVEKADEAERRAIRTAVG